MPNKITEVTRREIIDYLRAGPHAWHGRFDEVQFLRRIFDLESLPSTDSRFDNAAEDIWQHTVNNPSDWEPDWVFYDERFNFLDGSDETFLRFLCETVHPVVRPDAEETARLVKRFNENLGKDGWEIAEATRISNKPVFAARPLIEGSGVSVKAAKEVAGVLDAHYISQQITRMETAVQTDDPELAIGTAKEFIETISKTILTERNVSFGSDESLSRLVKLAIGALSLVPDTLVEAGKAEKNVRVLLKNLGSIAHQLNELRNKFGTGHGKDATHDTLERRHARLAVNAASTLGVFLFECHRQTPNPARRIRDPPRPKGRATSSEEPTPTRR